jgi:hypothetical protein
MTESNKKKSNHQIQITAPTLRGVIKYGVPQRSILGPLLFLVYINDLPLTIHSQSKPILFADDTNIIISHPEADGFQICMNDAMSLNKWIKANKLTLNSDKTNFMKFCINNKTWVNLNIGYDDKTIEEVETTKFLGLQIDNNLKWKKHIQYIIPKLSSACFAMRTITSLMKTETLKLVYFAYFHSIMSYGIIFWEIRWTAKKYCTSKRKSYKNGRH